MADDLQFERADYGEQATLGAPCGACKAPLRERYFEVNGKRWCERCRASIDHWPPGSSGKRLGRALIYGVGWAFVGAVVYYAIARIFGIELALISIFIGFYVGRGVKVGAYGVGGAGYQALAMALTYLSIASAHYFRLLDFLTNQGKQITSTYGYVVLARIAIEAPFLGGINVLGILIIGFGMYQAWRLNKRFVFAVSGPFEIKQAVAEPVAATPEPAPTEPDAA